MFFGCTAAGPSGSTKLTKNIAAKLVLPRWDDPKANVCQMVYEYLSNTTHDPWLMVLDNADYEDTFYSPSTVQGSVEQEPLVQYLPRSLTGCIIITTRDKRVGRRLSDSKPIIVGSFTLEEASQLLQSKVSQNDDTTGDDIEDLVEAIEFIPLAITQAAAFINENEISVTRYVSILREGPTDAELVGLMDHNIPDNRRDFESSNSVIQTWALSFERIREKNPLAGKILSLMAVLDRQGIPQSLLHIDNELKSELISVLGVLKAYSLIIAERNEEIYVLHRLVQIFTQDWLKREGDKESYQGKALQILSKEFPRTDFENWDTCEALRPHVQVAVQYSNRLQQHRLWQAELQLRLSRYEVYKGQYKIGYQHAEMSYRERYILLGGDNGLVITSLSFMVRAAQLCGLYEQLEPMARQVLAWRTSVLGEEDELTLTAARYLAYSLGKLEQYEECEKLQRRTLALLEKQFGLMDTDTLKLACELARTLYEQDKLDEAETIIRQNIELRTEIHGPNHREVLPAIGLFGSILRDQGRYKEAKPLLEQELLVNRLRYGEKHPATLRASTSYASSLIGLDEPKEAESILRHTLELQDGVLTRAHPHTLSTMSRLAQSLAAQHNHEAAEQMNRDILMLEVKVSGETHRDTLRTMEWLAFSLRAQKKYKEAENMYKETLKGFEEVFGKTHPRTIEIENELAQVSESLKEQTPVEQAVQKPSDSALGHTLKKNNTATLSSSSKLPIAQIRNTLHPSSDASYPETTSRHKSNRTPTQPDPSFLHEYQSVTTRRMKHSQPSPFYREVLPRG